MRFVETHSQYVAHNVFYLFLNKYHDKKQLFSASTQTLSAKPTSPPED